jgi:outer membrane biosynthesis protein TonB
MAPRSKNKHAARNLLIKNQDMTSNLKLSITIALIAIASVSATYQPEPTVKPTGTYKPNPKPSHTPDKSKHSKSKHSKSKSKNSKSKSKHSKTKKSHKSPDKKPTNTASYGGQITTSAAPVGSSTVTNDCDTDLSDANSLLPYSIFGLVALLLV